MPLDTDKIKRLREAAGLTQEEAAKRAGLRSRQHWYKIETDDGANVTLETLEKVARALKTKAKELIK